jgi:hypothetical protein
MQISKRHHGGSTKLLLVSIERLSVSLAVDVASISSNTTTLFRNCAAATTWALCCGSGTRSLVCGIGGLVGLVVHVGVCIVWFVCLSRSLNVLSGFCGWLTQSVSRLLLLRKIFGCADGFIESWIGACSHDVCLSWECWRLKCYCW